MEARLLMDREWMCNGCGRRFPVVVEVGEERTYESSTALLCRSCLLEAVAVIDSQQPALSTAAPDLYAACKLAMESFERQYSSESQWKSDWDVLQKAVAKADGKAPPASE